MAGYHILAFFVGYILDMLFGDPYWLPHPIRLIGNLIAALDRKLLGENDKKNPFFRGVILVLAVMGSTVAVTAALLILAYRIWLPAGVILESIMTYQILAAKCLKVESMKVYQALETGDIEASRNAVSMIVGRDTAQLDQTGVAKAAIETVAENTSDGVIAPMIYTAIGGPVLGFLYKANKGATTMNLHRGSSLIVYSVIFYLNSNLKESSNRKTSAGSSPQIWIVLSLVIKIAP